ncbi:hypothetical protein B0H13DRAFT_2521162 [Mycena leptocephala]|nr:hypothetical protein B0H13DRAFT_2521162 [Mycena leptocephala]
MYKKGLSTFHSNGARDSSYYGLDLDHDEQLAYNKGCANYNGHRENQWIIITEGNKGQGQEYCNGNKYGCSKQVRRGGLIRNQTLATRAPHLKPNGPEPEPEPKPGPELRHVPKKIIIIREKKTVYRRLAKTRRLDTTRRRSSRLSVLGASCLLGTRPQEHRAQGALGAQVQAQGQAQAARLETRPAPRPKHKPKPTPSSTSRTHAARLKTLDAPRSRPPPKAKSQEIKKYKDKATRIRVRVKRPHNADPEGGVLRTSASRRSSQTSTHPELKPTPQERTPQNKQKKRSCARTRTPKAKV